MQIIQGVINIKRGVINIKRGVIITSLIDSPSYGPPRVLSVQNSPDISSLSENAKQYETKSAWNFLQSWLVDNKGVLKGGGFNYSSPPKNFFWGKVKKNGWVGRWWYLLTYFRGVTLFRKGLRYFYFFDKCF